VPVAAVGSSASSADSSSSNFSGDFAFPFTTMSYSLRKYCVQCISFTPFVTPLTCDSAGSAIAAAISFDDKCVL